MKRDEKKWPNLFGSVALFDRVGGYSGLGTIGIRPLLLLRVQQLALRNLALNIGNRDSESLQRNVSRAFYIALPEKHSFAKILGHSN